MNKSLLGKCSIREYQRGSVMVETALTISLFMLLVMAILELAMLVFDWTRAVEATRESARLLVVSEPPADLSSMDCDGGTTQVSFTCAEADCGTVLDRAQGLAPNLQAENLRITFSCSSAGYQDRPEDFPLYLLTVEVEGLTSDLRIPALAGFPAEIPIPGFRTSRVTEDLHTPETGE